MIVGPSPARALVVVLVAVSGALPAADMAFTDLRLSVGFLSPRTEGSSSTTVEGPGLSGAFPAIDDDENATATQRGQLQVVFGRLGLGGGLVTGVGVAVNRATWHDGLRKIQVTAPVMNVLAGYGYAFNTRWHAELTPMVGFGRASYTITQDDGRRSSATWEPYVEFGGRLATFVQVNKTTMLGLEIPYLISRFRSEFETMTPDGRTATVRETHRQQGLGLLVSVGVRW